MRRTIPLVFSALSVACAVPASSVRGGVAHAPEPPPAQGPSGAPKGPLAWAELDASTFARAKRENRFVVVDGSAEWCHWCHVMEATSYHDPEVRKILDARFIAVKVDIDARPDFEERYHDWGWPATVLMTADGQEIGKYKGYLAPEKFVEILQTVVASGGSDAAAGTDAGSVAEARPMTEGEIAEIDGWARARLDGYWDPAQGSWGTGQKVPLYWDNAWALGRARSGDEQARKRALFALDQQRRIIDPIWGGVCQYSTDGDWLHPHFERLQTFQAGAIDNYATAYALTHDQGWLATAQLVRRFVDGFMTSPEGGFYATMDADLNAHDPSKPYVTGHEYYAKGDAERRALGIPRVDTHEYARENGLTIAAYVTLYEASGDASALASARRAADHVLATHASEKGGVTHGAKGGDGTSAARPPGGQDLAEGGDEGKVFYLADNAAFGFGLVRLYEATKDAKYLDASRRVADFVLAELYDPKGGGFWSSTPDPNAVGIFAARRKPFEDDVMALRMLARVARVAPTTSDARSTDSTRDAIARSMRVVATREAVSDRGRMIGDFLLALDETKGMR
jgi:uncharacterized protein YyaL (SSP411 family)